MVKLVEQFLTISKHAPFARSTCKCTFVAHLSFYRFPHDQMVLSLLDSAFAPEIPAHIPGDAKGGQPELWVGLPTPAGEGGLPHWACQLLP